ncbi:hypothetical protein LWI29_008340 [Acer saccharum]|uniref:Bulb-type lectin domain-containing protein n=1 Tax=Acer saccharum TaxID=4024 RepID=A0AA39S4N7_ACESA|nr:hypothetical protein LWI29_008340 [Acer saccharum]
MKLQAPSLLTVLIFLFLSFQTSTSLLTRGSSLSVEDNSHVLTSPNSSDRTVVWMANRDRPVNGQGSRVSLRRNGAMVLTDVDGTVIWMTNTTSADRAELLDSGNLVFKNLQEPKCSCPPGYEVMEPGNWNKACKPKFNRTCSKQVKFIKLPHVDFYGNDLNFSRYVSLGFCMKLCLDDCRCEAFSYRITGEGLCFTKSVLFNGLNTPNFPGTIYLKLPLNVKASEPTSLVGTDLVWPSSVTKVVIGTSSMYDTAIKRIRWVYRSLRFCNCYWCNRSYLLCGRLVVPV